MLHLAARIRESVRQHFFWAGRTRSSLPAVVPLGVEECKIQQTTEKLDVDENLMRGR